ncbi:MAG: MBL fold metallo-hydrolase [Spirochaetales bacterium]|nr:MBL fold metallo-hydrolase [Spirochaetales bacterium]
MSIRIVTLVENSPGSHKGLRSEHGLSFYIEKSEKKILFDTGQSAAFLENAGKLNIDLAALDCVCISHGHYDHSGGVRHLIKAGIRSPLVVGKGFFEEKYSAKNTTYEYVGNDFDERFLRNASIPFREIDQSVEEIIPGVYAVTQFKRIHPDETPVTRFKLVRKGSFEQDLFEDEILLVLDTPRGLVVLLGCSHPGWKNMIDTVRERFQKPIYAVLGGTHMVDASEKSIEESLDYLKNGVAELVGFSHCTGEKTEAAIIRQIKGAFPNHTGTMVWIEG